MSVHLTLRPANETTRSRLDASRPPRWCAPLGLNDLKHNTHSQQRLRQQPACARGGLDAFAAHEALELLVRAEARAVPGALQLLRHRQERLHLAPQSRFTEASAAVTAASIAAGAAQARL